jgi:hypothetical protein
MENSWLLKKFRRVILSNASLTVYNSWKECIYRHQWGITHLIQQAAIVKDYQMPADEQRLSDCIIVWGRRQIILRGGNRGVEAAEVAPENRTAL